MSEQPTLVAKGLTDRGLERSKNEDAFVIAKLQWTVFIEDTSLDNQAARWFGGAVEGWLLVVADGMGGHGGGDVASRVAAQTIVNYLCNVMPWMTRTQNASADADAETNPSTPTRAATASIYGLRDQLTEAMAEGDTFVRSAAQQPGASPRMGTTLTLAYVLWPALYIAHAGDSRAYLIRDGALQRLTTDHTIAQQLIDSGYPGVDESSQLNHILWNALGATDSQLAPEVSRHELQQGDRILLCSDGLNKHVSEDELLQIIMQNSDPATTCQQLVARANEGGGSDNITAVIGHCDVPAANRA